MIRPYARLVGLPLGIGIHIVTFKQKLEDGLHMETTTSTQKTLEEIAITYEPVPFQCIYFHCF